MRLPRSLRYAIQQGAATPEQALEMHQLLQASPPEQRVVPMPRHLWPLAAWMNLLGQPSPSRLIH